MKSKREILDHLYKDIHSPSAYTSLEPLHREAVKIRKDISRGDIQNYLESQHTYTLHRRAVRRYPTIPTLAPGLHTEWQADLSIFDRLSRQNQGYKYLLVCIDTLSRQLFVEPVKTKSAPDMVKAFDKIFTRPNIFIPWKIKTDQGKEFLAKKVQEYFKEKQIQHFCMYTSPRFHAGMAERANRTIKERLYRYFTERRTQNWTGVIQQLIDGINHSHNATIGMRPVDVNFNNAEALRIQLENKAIKKFKNKSGKKKFQVGDEVRIEKHKHIFQKGFTPNFTTEIFLIDQVRDTVPYQPISYRIRDKNGELIKGWFYAPDFSRIRDLHTKTTQKPEQQIYDIEKIIKKTKKEGREYLYVKWKGYGSEHNSWIPASTLLWK